MSMTALNGSGASGLVRRVSRTPAVVRRLTWISVILGVMSLDVEALAALSAVVPSPSRWYAELLLLYGPSTVVIAAMLMLGGPLAITGLAYTCAAVRRGRASYAMLLGVALCSVSLAIPLSYALFVGAYLRGLL